MVNKKKNGTLRGFGFYIALILVVILIWYWLSGSTATNSYTKDQFQDALDNGKVDTVTVVQNREIPTGSLKVKYKNGTQQILYTSDVNEMQDLMEKYDFTDYTCADVPEESWLMTLLPYLLIFGACFILFTMLNNQAAAQNGGGKMMNFGKNRAKLSTDENNKVTFQNVAGLREEKEELEEIVDFLKAPKKYPLFHHGSLQS